MFAERMRAIWIITFCFLFVGCDDEIAIQSHSINESHDLELFNNISGFLRIELSSKPEKIANLDNLRAKPDAQIQSVKLEATKYNTETEQFRPLTQEELDSKVFWQSTITLRGEAGIPVDHTAPNGIFFTVSDLLVAVEETERLTRGKTAWFGGIDVHHIFFEGISIVESGEWEINWGS